MGAHFTVARNPDPESSLAYLIWLPLGEGLALKAGEMWPRTAKVYCHRLQEWTYRFLGAALALSSEEPEDPAAPRSL